MLSVVVPAFNEQDRIVPFLKELVDFAEKNSWVGELIVVDDGSSDATLQILNSFKKQVRILKHERNLGKGAAVRTGIMAAKGDFIVIADADGATSASQLPKMRSALRKFDAVFGSRNLPDSKIISKKPFVKMVLSKLFNFYADWLFGFGCSDLLCGFKGFRSEIAKHVLPSLVSDRWIFDVELLARLKAKNSSIGEIPINWSYVHGSKMKINMETLSFAFSLYKLKKMLQKEGLVF